MMHSSTICGSMPARRIASRTTRAPSCGAVKPLSAPRNFPVGVRTAETITECSIVVVAQAFRPAVSGLSDDDARDGVSTEHRLHSREDHGLGSRQFARPLRAGGFDDERAGFELDRGRALERV